MGVGMCASDHMPIPKSIPSVLGVSAAYVISSLAAHVLTVDACGTPEAAATWMLQLDPIAIVIDITAAPGSDCWSSLIGLQQAATRERVPFVMTTRSKRVLDVPVGTTRVIEVTNHDDRETLAAAIARMVAPVLGRELREMNTEHSPQRRSSQ
jgi:hypothetical protein